MDNGIIYPPPYYPSYRKNITYTDCNPKIEDPHYSNFLRLIQPSFEIEEEKIRSLYRELRVDDPIPKHVFLSLISRTPGTIDIYLEHYWLVLKMAFNSHYIHDENIKSNPDMLMFLFTHLRAKVMTIKLDAAVWTLLKNRQERKDLNTPFTYDPIYYYLSKAHVNELKLKLKLMGYITDAVGIMQHVGKVDKLYVSIDSFTLTSSEIEEQMKKKLLPVLLSSGVKYCQVDVIYWTKSSATPVGDEINFVLLDR